MLEKMKALAKEKDICVLATVSGGNPHCSLMAYVTDDDCREIFMATYRQTAKYANLTENPSVSLLIDTREEHCGAHRPEAKALTVSGVFQTIRDEKKRTHVRRMLLERHPHLKAFLENPDAEIFSIEIGSFLLLDGLTNAHFEPVERTTSAKM
jgi:nitroimidazol reductase NimA-like FMN-containing flavoprotein (pyridoxamine 5'-phosphate oxidase superfamily)